MSTAPRDSHLYKTLLIHSHNHDAHQLEKWLGLEVGALLSEIRARVTQTPESLLAFFLPCQDAETLLSAAQTGAHGSGVCALTKEA